MYFLLHFFTVHSKDGGPTITASNMGQHLICNGWQSLSVSPWGTAACSSQHSARSALARQRCVGSLRPLHSCKEETRNKSFPSPCSSLQHPLCISFRVLVTVSSELWRNLELLQAMEVLLLTCPSAFCHYWSACTLGRSTPKNNCFLLVTWYAINLCHAGVWSSLAHCEFVIGCYL